MRRSEFCCVRGLSFGTLQRHLNKQEQGRNAIVPGSQLVAVELAGMSRNESGGLAVVLASGRKIEVARGFDVSTLERLVTVLERVCAMFGFGPATASIWRREPPICVRASRGSMAWCAIACCANRAVGMYFCSAMPSAIA